MAIVIQQQSVATKRIFTTQASGLDRRQLKVVLAGLKEKRRITERDERLLEYLRELRVLSLNQVQRLLWPRAKPVTADKRLQFLLNHHLLAYARIPRSGMQDWGLPVSKVYALGDGGRVWLEDKVDDKPATLLKRNQVLHDLLVAEVCARLTEATLTRGPTWRLAWAGEKAAGFCPKRGEAPLIAPDGLSVVAQKKGRKRAQLPLFLELDASREAHGRPSSDWGRKVNGYDRFCAAKWRQHPELSNLTTFPLVAVVTHGEQRLQNLVAAINKHRQQKVIYYLALWEDLVDGDDLLAAPAWLVVTPDGQVTGQKREQRLPLLQVQ